MLADFFPFLPSSRQLVSRMYTMKRIDVRKTNTEHTQKFEILFFKTGC